MSLCALACYIEPMTFQAASALLLLAIEPRAR